MRDVDKGHQSFDFKSSHAKLGTQKSDEGNDRNVFEQLSFCTAKYKGQFKAVNHQWSFSQLERQY